MTWTCIVGLTAGLFGGVVGYWLMRALAMWLGLDEDARKLQHPPARGLGPQGYGYDPYGER